MLNFNQKTRTSDPILNHIHNEQLQVAPGLYSTIQLISYQNSLACDILEDFIRNEKTKTSISCSTILPTLKKPCTVREPIDYHIHIEKV